MTQLQQTIGNTVYRVGQILDYYQMLELPSGAEVKISREMVGKDLRLFTILALPNPDPVAEDWRELMNSGCEKIEYAMMHPYVRIDWPGWSAAYRKYGACTELDKQTESRDDYCYECEKFLIRAVALGGRVFVKGGV